MGTIAKINEEYTNTKSLKILTARQLEIPGLHLFGRQIRTAAIDTLPPHEHGNRFEIVYVCSGNPSFSIGDQSYVLSGGDVFVTQPHQIHGTSSLPVSVSEMYWIQLELTECSDSLFLSAQAQRTLAQKLHNLPSPVIATDLTEMKKLVQSGFRTAMSGQNPQLTSQYLTLFLYLVLEYAEHTQAKITPDMENAVRYIENNLDRNITLEELAGISHLSVSQFKQKFKRQLGVAPRQFINSHKIRKAKEMIRQGLSTSEISDRLGFESASYFITVFRRYTSCTPGEYRQEHL